MRYSYNFLNVKTFLTFDMFNKSKKDNVVRNKNFNGNCYIFT